MRGIYSKAVILLLLLLPTSRVFSQCEDITIGSLANPGIYDVATLTEADGLRNGPNYFGATVYYPTNATPPYASIAIVPGFSASPDSVEQWGPFYASHGIVTIIIGTNSIFDFPEARAEALLDALETLREENTRNDSPLLGAIDEDKFAVSGHSMGGGGAQRAAVLDNSIKGVVALCPWLPNPDLDHSSPVVIFSGQNDAVAPPGVHANIHYDNTPNSTNKLLFEIENGDHSVANTPDGGNTSVGKIALSWFNLYVAQNDCYCSLLTDYLQDNPLASNIESSFECEILNTQENLSQTILYPNPTRGIITISTQENVRYSVYSTLGQLLLSGELKGSTKQLNLLSLPGNIFYVRVNNDTFKVLKTQ
ncbi:MAG: Poly(ethylene terephthalate) hydrolase [Flavobacteriaceae bacterium]|nr:MAG: Poly(ethylene terephthalate) hydrolase [Flavobacteriaceae bacterium]